MGEAYGHHNHYTDIVRVFRRPIGLKVNEPDQQFFCGSIRRRQFLYEQFNGAEFNVMQNFEDELFFDFDVVVNRPFGKPRRIGNLFKTGVCVAFRRNQVQGSGLDFTVSLLTVFLGLHCFFFTPDEGVRSQMRHVRCNHYLITCA